MIKLYWTNFNYAADRPFASIEEAIAYGKGQCFEFHITVDGVLAYAWSSIGGGRYY